ncbi:alpha/beta hydrolase family protein [Tautonia marina]|uniref:alpha/beta hydrolase family protein n=1 Tax=Tautonia marina TaxID=2653855 RepID=UPI0013758107|nr:alpha/beta hydrolase [Tautonia marina]
MTSLILATALLTSAVPGTVQDEPSPVLGHWVGTLKVGPIELILVLHVTSTDEGELAGTLDSPDQGSFGLKVDQISLDDRTLQFESQTVAASFEGTLAEDGQTIKGTFHQGGRANPITLTLTPEDELPRPVDAPEVLLGIWQGPIELPLGQTLRVAIRVEPVKGSPDTRRAVFDSIDQDVKGIPVTAISVENKAVRFEVKSIGGSFEGTINDDRTRIEGQWTQSILSLPLSLEKVEATSTLNRPQHPEPPFPYAVEEVTFANPAAEIQLAGTLTIPEGDGPFPAAVLVSGSGPQDRDETIVRHKPFLVIADHLTRAGIAVLRFDDRGVGKSEGDHASATTEDFATDALAAVRFLRNRPEIDSGTIGIIGHSEGGVIGPLAAIKAPEDVAFLVLLAGTGVTGREIILRQTDLIARASGLPDELVAFQVKVLDELTAPPASGKAAALDTEAIEALTREALEVLSPEQRTAMEESDVALALSASELQRPWFRFFLTYDPRPALRQVTCPVLALFGEKDLQVDPTQNAPEVEAALRESGNPQSSVVLLPGLNHLFQHTESGSPTEYGSIEETIAPEVLDQMTDWIRSVTSRNHSRKAP